MRLHARILIQAFASCPSAIYAVGCGPGVRFPPFRAPAPPTLVGSKHDTRSDGQDATIVAGLFVSRDGVVESPQKRQSSN
jgi:hypothetical protein